MTPSQHIERAWVARESAERARDEALAVIAHELRNPVHVIATANELLAELVEALPSKERAEARRILDIHRRQVALASRLIADLFDVSLLRAGKLVVDRAPVDLGPLVLSSIEAHRADAERAGVELSVQPSPEPLFVALDVPRFEQIVANLVSNAIKHTRPGDHIEVCVGREVVEGQPMASVLVRDDGVGIPKPELDTIFDRFVQLNPRATDGEQGLGLGLTLVRQLVTLHGGSVSAWSEGVGKGSTFVVRLPLTPVRRGLASAKPRPAPHRTFPHLTVLLVDDDADLRELLRFQLERARCRVLEATNATDAIAVARAMRPHVALIDLGLPERSGMAVARELGGDPSLAGMRLVAMSGDGSHRTRRRAIEAGFDAHLVKPLALGDLEKELAQAGPS